MAEGFRVDLQRARRFWQMLMMIQVVIIAGGTATLLFSGYRPGPISSIDFAMCLLLNSGAPIAVGFVPARVLTESDPSSDEAVSAAFLGVVQPIVGLLAWIATTLMFRAFIRGWTPPWVTMMSNPFALWATTLALGVLLTFAIPRLFALFYNARKAG